MRAGVAENWKKVRLVSVKAEIHSLNWPDAEERIPQQQAAVFQHFQLPIRQHRMRADHSQWMDAVLKNSRADVVLFVDNDCVPLSREAVMEAISWAQRNNSFLGLAQAMNHINNGIHVFAAQRFWPSPAAPGKSSDVPAADPPHGATWPKNSAGKPRHKE